jgi:hypothetical protein
MQLSIQDISVDYVPSLYKQFITWCFFLVAYILAWNMAIIGAIQRLDAELDSGTAIRRPYVVALGVYAFTVALFTFAACSMVSYCACTVLCMTAGMAPKWWEDLMRVVALPSTVFNCISLDHVKIHAVMFFVTIVAFALTAWMYVTEEDMRQKHGDRVRSKVMRMIFVFPGGVLLTGYGMYALYSMFSAYILLKRIKIVL